MRLKPCDTECNSAPVILATCLSASARVDPEIRAWNWKQLPRAPTGMAVEAAIAVEEERATWRVFVVKRTPNAHLVPGADFFTGKVMLKKLSLLIEGQNHFPPKLSLEPEVREVIRGTPFARPEKVFPIRYMFFFDRFGRYEKRCRPYDGLQFQSP